jgi:ATP-dependent Zn protease
MIMAELYTDGGRTSNKRCTLSNVLVVLALAAIFLIAWGIGHLTPGRSKNPLPKPSTASLDTTRCRTAVHEAGHALAALRCTLVTKVTQIVIQEDELGGEVTWQIAAEAPNTAWCTLVVALAGLAAETFVFGKVRSGPSSSDLMKARKLATEIATTGRTTPPWGTAKKSWPFRFTMYATPLTAGEHQILQAAYDTARGLLVTHESSHAYLTSRILACGRVDQALIEEWFGSRRFMVALGDAFGGRFF